MAKTDKPAKTESQSKEVKPTTPPPRGALSPFDEMEQMMERMFSRDLWPWPSMHWPRTHWPEFKASLSERIPKVDVINCDDEVIVKAELPGVAKEDLDVSVTDTNVTIKTSTKKESSSEEGDYHRREIHTGEYSRTVGLPGDVDGSKAKATFKDGMLELVLPKVVKAKRHNVDIK